MGLKHKLNLLSINFTLIVIMLLGLILFVSSNRSFYMVEDTIFQEKLDTLKHTFEKELYDLEYILRDWAEWDMTYDFVNGARPNYVEENFGDDTLSDLDIDYVYLFDDDGNMVHSIMDDPEDDLYIPIDDQALETFSQHPRGTGLLLVNDQLVLYASMGISDNNGTRQPSGFMGFARIVDEDYIHSLSTLSGLQLSMTYEAKDTLETGENFNPYETVTTLRHNTDFDSLFILKVPIQNADKNLVLQASSDNAIQALGQTYTMSVLVMVVIILGSFGFLLNIAFSKLVLNRLLSLNHQIAFIRNVRNTRERLPEHGDDEIGELSRNINLMLEEIDSIHSEISKYATFDEMTGVYNRRVGLDILDEFIQNFNDNQAVFSVIYVDIDGLKKVNDRFGHSFGDSLIKDSIDLILQELIEPRYVVRLGGDEFLLILKNHTYAQAKALEERICDSILNYNKSSNRVYTLSLSMGSIEYEANMQLEGILELADKKMYRSKQKKKTENSKPL